MAHAHMPTTGFGFRAECVLVIMREQMFLQLLAEWSKAGRVCGAAFVHPSTPLDPIYRNLLTSLDLAQSASMNLSGRY